jgi:hypothetical protein
LSSKGGFAVGGVGAVMTIAIAAGCRGGVLDEPPGMIAAGGGAGNGIASRDGSGAGGGTMPTDAPCLKPTLTAGEEWDEVSPPAGVEGLQVSDSFVVAADDLLFAGTVPAAGNPSTSSAQILRWTGACWKTEMSAPMAAGMTPSMAWVADGLDEEIWATTGSALYHRDAGGWSRADADLQALLSASHPGEAIAPAKVRVGVGGGVWVVGGHYVWQRSGSGSGSGNGTTWRMLELGEADVFGNVEPENHFGSFKLNALWTGIHPDDVTVGGTLDTAGRLPNAAVICRYQTSKWLCGGVADGSIRAMAGDGVVGDLWIAVANGGLNPPLFHVERSGTSATTVAIPGWPEGVQVSSLLGLDWNDAWATGADSLAHWNGFDWSLSAAPGPSAAGGATFMTGINITGSDGDALWVVRPGPRFFRGYFSRR